MSSAVPEPGSSAACNRASRSCWSRALRGLGDHPFDDWYYGRLITRALQRVVRRPDGPGNLRILAACILYGMASTGPVRSTLRQLTFDSDEEEAREAAALLLYPHIGKEDGRPVEEALFSGPPVVREEAAIVIGQYCFRNVQPKTHMEVALHLAARRSLGGRFI